MKPAEQPAKQAGSVLTGKTAQAILWLLVLCAIAAFRDDPRELLRHLSFQPSQGVSLISHSPSAIERTQADVHPVRVAPAVVGTEEAAASLGISLAAPDLNGATHPIEDPTGLAMRAFYESLGRTVQKQPGAITRILHYGDSLVVVDFLTGQVRRRLQERFGDAGHGYMLAGKPWRWYQHWDVTYRTSRSWQIDGIMKHTSGYGDFGVGGYAFDGYSRSEYFEMGTSRKGEFGRTASRFEVHYLTRPGGGSFEVFVDGKLHSRVNTAGPVRRSGVHTVRTVDSPHKFRVECTGDGPVRIFGGALERDVPGIVYDTLGINGARARTLERLRPELWAEQLRLRKPNLVIVNFGTNESEDVGRPMTQVEADYLSVLQRLRAVIPEASCLVMAPLDRAARVNGQLTTKPILPQLVQAQRRAALKAGCAFYDTYQAMGGRGSMARWYQMRPRLCAGDMTHPTRRGADIIGDGLYRSFVLGLVGYKSRVLASGGGIVSEMIEYDPLLPAEPDPYPPMPEWPRTPY